MNVKDTQRREKILNGKMVSVIFSICMPLFIYNFFNTLYNFLDTIMVANINSHSVSSVASINQIKDLIGSLGAGIAGGGGILIARSFGANAIEKAQKYVRVLTSLALFIVSVLFGICLPFSQQILALGGLDSTLISIGLGYFIVQIITLGFVFYNSVFISIQKAKGDTTSIFYLNFVMMGIKLALTSFFIYVLQVSDVIWVALATLVSQVTLFLILLIKMNKKDSLFKVSLFRFDFSLPFLKKIVLLSFPVFLGKFVFSFGKVAVNAMCSSYGPLVVGALAVSNNICGLVTSPVGSFEEGGSTIVSQNLGNKNLKRALEAFWKSLIISTLFGIVGYILVRFVFQQQLIEIFATGKTMEEIENAKEFMRLIKQINDYDTLSIIALAINSAVLGVLYGFGKTGLSMIINFSRVFVFRIPVLFYFQTFHPEMGAECAGISMGISNILIALLSLSVLGIFLWKLKRRGKSMAYGV